MEETTVVVDYPRPDKAGEEGGYSNDHPNRADAIAWAVADAAKHLPTGRVFEVRGRGTDFQKPKLRVIAWYTNDMMWDKPPIQLAEYGVRDEIGDYLLFGRQRVA
ncbi:MAG: hypothetical protein NUV51_09705 [Sulfuricaulis sp.]|nr:hypothetical protein [Sulfuricaulis sp.]